MWSQTALQFPALILVTLCGSVLVAGLSDMLVELRGPRYVVHGHSAALRCEHNVDPDKVYKVVFYKHGQRIMKYVQGRQPPYVISNVTGAYINIHYRGCRHPLHLSLVLEHPSTHGVGAPGTYFSGFNWIKFGRPAHQLTVFDTSSIHPRMQGIHAKRSRLDKQESKVTPTSIKLENMDFSASGHYACEIALETPLYSKVSKPHELNIIVRQKYRPKMQIKNKKYSSNDHLDATCVSSGAHPAPHLTWFVNGIKVDESHIVPHGTLSVRRHHHGMPLLATNSSLHFPLATLQLFPKQTVDITCLSTIPSYANVGEGFTDVQNSTVSVNVRNELQPSTLLPVKIVSSELNSSGQCEISLIFILTLCFAIVAFNS